MNNVTLNYGPTEENGIVKYRPLILKRLIDILQNLDFQISIKRIKPRDRLVMFLSGCEIFRCRLSFLKDYGTSRKISKEETTLEKTIFAAIEARARFEWSPI